MSNDTQRLARQWADKILTSEAGTPEALAAAEHIKATTTPLTMADVEWDNEEHHLAGATTPEGNDVVMMWWDDIDTDYIVTEKSAWQRRQLTPNGKRYELREVGEPEQLAHPATLVTEQDYENAPAGTVVADSCALALTKHFSGEWTADSLCLSNPDMAGREREVLRRGWGK